MKQKTQDNHNRNVNIGLTITLAIVLACGIALRTGLIKEEKEFAPGHSVSKKERAEIDAMRDSVLLARTARWNDLYNDYQAQLQRARNIHIERNKHFMDHNHKIPVVELPDTIKTLNEYKKRVQKHLNDSIEARYQELAKQLVKQK